MIKIFAAGIIFAAGLSALSSAQAAGGCGAGEHRGPYGHCRLNGVAPAPVVVAPAPVVVAPAPVVVAQPNAVYAPVGRACPLGYHLGPQGRRCLPN
jgi:hypothetical protein